MASEEGEEDARIVYVGTMAKITLNIPDEVWGDFIWKEENQAIIKDFMDTPATRILLIYTDRKGKLCAVVEYDPDISLPKKMMYFLKYEPAAIPSKDFANLFMCGNLTSTPLKQFQVIFEQVMIPILSNPKNYKLWPREVVEDITLHAQDFRKTLSHILGLAQGKTSLPIPEAARNVELLDLSTLTSSSMSDPQIRGVVYSIETLVVDWTYVINEVLELDSEQSLTEGQNLGPLSEITFWKERVDNLHFIYTQMNNPLVEKMAIALEKTNNCYFPAYRNLFLNVVAALSEAEDITVNLEVLRDCVKQMEECEYPQLYDNLSGAMNTITQSWSGSRYFSSAPSRICVLVQKICNLLIEKTHDYLVPADLFKGDRGVNEDRVELAVDTLGHFIDVYNECRDTMSSSFQYSKLYPWEFPDDRVFFRLKRFIQRLDDIQEIFEDARQYYQIPTLGLIGIAQYNLKVQLDAIFEEFSSVYEIFVESKYDSLDFEGSKDFEENLQTFRSKVEDLDMRLGAVISQGCLQCATSGDAFELIRMLENMISNPRVAEKFKSCLHGLTNKICEEITMAKEMYQQQVDSVKKNGTYIVSKNMPPFSGAIQWSLDLQEKLTSSVNSLKHIEQYVKASKEISAVYQMHAEVMQLLSEFKEAVYNRWSTSVSSLINEKLNKTVLSRVSDDTFELNFDSWISEAINEARYLQALKYENLPANALTTYEKSETFHDVSNLVLSSLIYYNDLLENINPLERLLVCEQWKKMKKLLIKGIHENWASSGLTQFASDLYEATKYLHEITIKANENVKKLKESIDSWRFSAMYEREEDGFLDLSTCVTDRVRKHIDKIKKTAALGQQILKEDLELFKCDPESEIWKKYVRYLDQFVEDGIKDAISFNLDYISKNTNPEDAELTPYIKVELRLEYDFAFYPSMKHNCGNDLVSLIDLALEKIFDLATKINRLSSENDDYTFSVEICREYRDIKYTVLKHITHGISKVLEVSRENEKYSGLWLQDITDVLTDFLMYGPPPEAAEDEEEEEEEEISEEEELKPLELKPPTEEEFRVQKFKGLTCMLEYMVKQNSTFLPIKISQFEQLLRNVEDIPCTKLVESWLLVDLTKFKKSLLCLVDQWLLAYKKSFVEQKSLGKLRKIVKEED